MIGPLVWVSFSAVKRQIGLTALELYCLSSKSWIIITTVLESKERSSGVALVDPYYLFRRTKPYDTIRSFIFQRREPVVQDV